MRQRLPILLVVAACLMGLVVACFGRAFLKNEQFAYRDAAHFYYPLYERVQQEWRAGRWPLWEPEENGGMPLMGNPTAAVLYPGKLLFAATDYPTGVKLYVVAHTLLAFAATFVLCRGWGVGHAGSAIGALAYAFGGPILFQYCNIIYLVGAAWVPLGFHGADRWLRLGNRWGLVELAVVLAMETLGGDPEVAYLTGVCAGGYALALARGRYVAARKTPPASRRSGEKRVITLAIGLFCLWLAATFAMAVLAKVFRPVSAVPLVLPWMPFVAPTILGVWAVVGLVVLSRWRRGGDGPVRWLVPMLGGLVVSAVGAGLLSAAQLLPVMEFTGQSARAASGGPHDIYPFSLTPARVVEFVWPNVFGTPFHGNRAWLSALPPQTKSVKVWVPTLYLGGLTLILALGAACVRRGPPWKVWMTAVAIVSLPASFGEFTGPLYYARFVPAFAERFGAHDGVDTPAIRFDRQLRDGDGSLYWMLSTSLPGFRQFRFPSKLLTLTVMALAVLAAAGWDDVLGANPDTRRRAGWLAGGLLLLTLLVLATTWLNRAAFAGWLKTQPLSSAFGPIDAPGAVAEMIWGLCQGAVALAGSIVLVRGGHSRPVLCSAAALMLLSADLGLANARFVLTVPQATMDATPEVLRVIRDAEAKDPAAGPYRVHRVPVWEPYTWVEKSSPDRVREFVEWERGTLQPKYGIESGLHFTTTLGVAELYDFEWFFGGFPRVADALMARQFGAKLGEKVVYFPRRSFDMWTTRYFVLPYYPIWTDEHRGIAAFLENSTRIYPPPDAFSGPDGKAKEVAWAKEHDYQVRRNLSEYPRAWVVHSARNLKSLNGMSRDDRDLPMQEILFANDSVWKDPTRTVYDPRTTAWVEINDRPALADYLRSTPVRPGEVATVTRYESDRVELDVNLESPGLVVLAEVFYPGWTLTIDGKPAPVYRTNRIMRGAAVPAGTHHLVYEFHPRSFRAGLIVSLSALMVLCVVGFVVARNPISPRLAPDDEPGRTLPS